MLEENTGRRKHLLSRKRGMEDTKRVSQLLQRFK